MKHHRFIFFCLAISLLSVIVHADPNDNDDGNVQGGSGDGKKASGGVFSAFVQSFTSIVVSEIGDKTFFIAAIMAMRYNRLAVLAGALLALFLMTGISTAFGYVVPKIIPPGVTHILITVLFFFFGGKLLYDAYNDDGNGGDEQEEVEVELNQLHSRLVKSSDRADPHQEVEIENVNGQPKKKSKSDMESNIDSPTKKEANCATKINQVQSKLVFWQALTMTFLGEWGDRSQITTIALAAESSALFVFVGAFLGHCLCTGFAVVGGKYLSDKISERTVNLSGGILFLLFGIHNLFMSS
jgi:putative Ca2+/H+ antiporter (TMEM165/GDT1 family)